LGGKEGSNEQTDQGNPSSAGSKFPLASEEESGRALLRGKKGWKKGKEADNKSNPGRCLECLKDEFSECKIGMGENGESRNVLGREGGTSGQQPSETPSCKEGEGESLILGDVRSRTAIKGL